MKQTPIGRRQLSGGTSLRRHDLAPHRTTWRGAERLKILIPAMIASVAAGGAAGYFFLPKFVLITAVPVVMTVAFVGGLFCIRRLSPSVRLSTRLALASLCIEIATSSLWEVAGLLGFHGLPVSFVLPIFASSALAVLSAWAAVEKSINRREALLDYSMVLAALASISVAAVSSGLNFTWTPEAVEYLALALMDLLVVVILSSTALGRWHLFPWPAAVAVCGLSCLALARWAAFLTAGGHIAPQWPAVLMLMAAILACWTVFSARVLPEQAIRVSRGGLPGANPGASLIVVIGSALAAALVISWGGVNESAADRFSPTVVVGLAALAWVAVAGFFRVCGSLAETRSAYRELDRAHFELEEAHATIEQRNAEFAAIHVVLSSLLDLADERTSGLLREQLEQSGVEIADWLELRSDPID